MYKLVLFVSTLCNLQQSIPVENKISYQNSLSPIFDSTANFEKSISLQKSSSRSSQDNTEQSESLVEVKNKLFDCIKNHSTEDITDLFENDMRLTSYLQTHDYYLDDLEHETYGNLLHAACEVQDLSLVSFFCNLKTSGKYSRDTLSINAVRSSDRLSPLHIAVLKANQALSGSIKSTIGYLILRELIIAGASPHTINRNGHSPYGDATENVQYFLNKYMLEYALFLGNAEQENNSDDNSYEPQNASFFRQFNIFCNPKKRCFDVLEK